jgi:hypothetical protein
MPLGFEWRAVAAKTCCVGMEDALHFECDQHEDPFACADALVVYHEPFDEYGLVIHDGGASYVLISHCPWCGATLPASRRDDWFDAVSACGIDPNADLPPEFLSAAWRASASARN